MGIREEFHVKNILVCVEELCGRGSSVVGSPGYSERVEMNHSHQLLPTSFSSLQRCDKCNKYLRGLLNQGKLCQSKL